VSLSSDSRDYGRFDELADEFAERYRRGERPSLDEYVDRLPEMADEIREKFPALVEVEQGEGDARADGGRPICLPQLLCADNPDQHRRLPPGEDFRAWLRYCSATYG
jgi:hypothetical protein